MFATGHWNVAIATGEGLVVLDIDPRNGGDATLATLLSEKGETLPETPAVATGGGGWHYYFAGDAPGRVLGPGLDLKGAGGYVVAPPSTHASGTRYRWLQPPVALAAAPPWFVAQLRTGPARQRPEDWAATARGGADEGRRNTTCTQLAGMLIARGIDPRVVHELLCGWDAGRNRPPLGPREIERIVLSIAKAEARKLRGRT